MKESNMETLRLGARRTKAIAQEKYKAGDLAGAKEFAVKAKYQNPLLYGLLRLHAILDVKIGLEKRINGEVDWYAVLDVEPTVDVATIQNRIKELLLYIVMDNGDDSVGSIDEAQKILADSWDIFCNENSKKLYDKQRQDQLQLRNMIRADYEKEQQVKVMSHVPSFTYTPVILSVPKPAHVETFGEAKVENFAKSRSQPPLRFPSPALRGSRGESKRKPPPSTNVVQVNQLSRINEDIVIRSIEREQEKMD